MVDRNNLEPSRAKALPAPPPYENGDKDGYLGGYGGLKATMVASSSSQSSVPHGHGRPDISLPSDITGTYYIEAKQPISDRTTRRKRKQKKIKVIPDAIFRSRRGNLSLDLATNGSAYDVPKASIVVSSKSGNISLNLISGADTRPRFDLEANTRSGDVVLFVPSTFSGAIQLHTKTGNLDFLPGITSAMQVVKSTDSEYLVFVRNTGNVNGKQADFCRLRTRSGNIIVGERGKDAYIKPTSIWQKLTGFLRG
ncbi:hypothetical protein B0H11DRAFT_2221800 [Mycena galericulata]|nr:hypothetical protein B0H11DRAFT_2221800 [Mycena galericulata]